MLSGSVLLRARVSRLTALLLVASGCVGLVAVWIWSTSGTDLATDILAVVATMVLAPIAFWVFPAPRWRTSADVVMGVALVAPGVAALAEPGDGTRVGSMALVAGTALLVQTWWRIERSTGVERRALQWFGLAAGASGFVAISLFFLAEGGGRDIAVVGVCGLAAISPVMALGVLRPDMVDVRGLVAYAVLLTVGCTAYVAYFVGTYTMLTEIGGVPPSAGVQAVVAFLGAVGLHPGAVMLRGLVDRLLFGDRPNALHAATSALDRSGTDPTSALDAVRKSLVLPYARLVVDGEAIAASGVEVTGVRSLPLALWDGTCGELVVGLRPGDLRLATQDEYVLRLVGPLLAQSVRSRALAEDLRTSRERAVAAIEEERRRLRRDLHDGLGPTLTGMAFSADAARNSLRADPDAADALLAALRSDAADAVDAIRSLVYGMRPPALDEVGLERALRQQAASLRQQKGGPLRVGFDIPHELPVLTAAVEVAAYRIVMEALTNVARHSGGGAAHVRLLLEGDRLVLDVSDTGSSTDSWRAGVGLRSMRERAAEVGGWGWSVVGPPRAVESGPHCPSPYRPSSRQPHRPSGTIARHPIP
ncbi:MAG: histidine kinase [Lapillicoccus sp.]